MTVHLFHLFLVAHICAGAVGLVVFWVPIVTRKGADQHVRTGRIFTRCMLATGTFAVGISVCTLIAPLATHPHMEDAALVRGVFGWMMLYLAVLTINLSWYGTQCIRNRRDHGRNRAWPNLALQPLVMVLAVNTALQGWQLAQPLLLGISVVGIATGVTNLRFIYRAPSRVGWQLEHIKGLVGAGISVYTAFFAFGAVRLMPELALSPLLWSAPLIVGLSLILWHWRQVLLRVPNRAGTATGAQPGSQPGSSAAEPGA